MALNVQSRLVVLFKMRLPFNEVVQKSGGKNKAHIEESLNHYWSNIFCMRIRYKFVLDSFIRLIIIPFLLFLILLSDIQLTFSDDTNTYFWTLSSIFQGLFSILAFVGIYVVFKIQQINQDVDNFHQEARRRLDDLKNCFENDAKYQKSVTYLDIRDFINLNKMLIELEKRLATTEQSFSLKTLKQRMDKISERRFVRDKVKAELIYPLLHGFFVIVLSIIFLPKPGISYNTYQFTLPDEIVIIALVVMTVVVVIETAVALIRIVWERYALMTA